MCSHLAFLGELTRLSSVRRTLHLDHQLLSVPRISRDPRGECTAVKITRTRIYMYFHNQLHGRFHACNALFKVRTNEMSFPDFVFLFLARTFHSRYFLTSLLQSRDVRMAVSVHVLFDMYDLKIVRFKNNENVKYSKTLLHCSNELVHSTKYIRDAVGATRHHHTRVS